MFRILVSLRGGVGHPKWTVPPQRGIHGASGHVEAVALPRGGSHGQVQERPTSKRGRIMWTVAAWVLFGPVAVGLAVLMGWWSAIVIVPAVLATRDYLRSGGIFEAVDGVSRQGAYLTKGLSRT